MQHKIHIPQFWETLGRRNSRPRNVMLLSFIAEHVWKECKDWAWTARLDNMYIDESDLFSYYIQIQIYNHRILELLFQMQVCFSLLFNGFCVYKASPFLAHIFLLSAATYQSHIRVLVPRWALRHTVCHFNMYTVVVCFALLFMVRIIPSPTVS